MNIFSDLISTVSVENVLHVGSSVYPILGAFLIACLGYLLGAIKIKGVSLGTAGVFLVAIAFGCIFSLKEIGEIEGLRGFYLASASPYKMVQNIGLILFVTAVGFVAGPRFFRDLKKNATSYALLGTVIILSGLIVAVLFALIPGIGSDFSAGILSGALTSTPGFSAANEAAASKGMETTMVSLGYAISYPFGVVGVVLFVQIVPKILKADKNRELELMRTGVKREKCSKRNKKAVENEETVETVENIETNETAEIVSENCEPVIEESKREVESIEITEKAEEKKKLIEIDPFGFAPFALAILLGIFLGSITIPISSKGYDGATFSLGNTGGPLIIALILGHFGRIGKISLKVPDRTLKVFRELGLMFFLIGAGVDGGFSLVTKINSGNFDAMIILYGFIAGALMTTIPMVSGFLVAKFGLKIPLYNNLGSVTGGMTSTPALGSLIAETGTEDVANAYAATYPVALVLVVLGCNLMVSLM